MDDPNRYAPPSAEVADITLPGTPGELYTPGQVMAGGYFGGPLAMIYLLRANFRTLGEPLAGDTVLRWGIVGSLALALVSLFLPDKFPGALITLPYAFWGKHIAESRQLSKIAIQRSGQYTVHSNWRVFGAAVGGGLVLMLLVFAFALTLESLGILRSPD